MLGDVARGAKSKEASRLEEPQAGGFGEVGWYADLKLKAMRRDKGRRKVDEEIRVFQLQDSDT